MGSPRSAISILQRPEYTAGFNLAGAEPARIERPVGISVAWRKLLMQVEAAAPHIRVAAMEGERGAGKLTLARYLFQCLRLSDIAFQRRDAREWLATDGDAASIKGLLYLDRVDLLTPPGQNLLMGVVRALETRVSERVVLLVSSQNSLRQMASQGLFLPDLAYRLTAFRFAVPPLRERREDIAPLSQTILDHLCIRYKQQPVALGPGSLARLLQHNWPGNVGELGGVLELALLEAVNGLILPANLALGTATEPEVEVKPEAAPESLSLDAVIRRHVQYVLKLNHGNKLRTARQLHISRSTLYRILENQSLMAH